jgi:16S rRNA (guanine1207-N2)-methyltransferase
MVIENLLPHRQTGPQKLWERHRESLNIENPLVIDTEQALFDAWMRFSLIPEQGIISPKPASALVYLPKSKPLIDMTLALVSGVVKKGGTVILVGGNDEGIRSSNELFEKNIGSIDEKIVGNHSAMYIGKNQALGAGKSLFDFLSYQSIVYSTMNIEVASLPGVFSKGALDAGTRLLLDTIPYTAKNVLDVGCGAGIIGTIYKKKSPESTITMCDVSPLAIETTKKTIEKNKIEAKVFVSDVFSNVTGEYGLILCNPPFHKGVGTDYSFIEVFARDAKKHLAKDGSIYIVCNSFLAYEKKLEAAGFSVSMITDNTAFKVLLAK